MYEMSLSDGASIADSATTASDGVDRRKKKNTKIQRAVGKLIMSA